MQIKFYKYNNLDIVPNKLKSATNVETINIDAPQIMQNLGISFLLDRAIEANIAEYWLKGIQYIAYVDYSTSGNNMYTYKLTIDALATAWYNKCFDRYNMVARSNLGNFKNDGALLRDTQVKRVITLMSDISNDYYVVLTAVCPEFNLDNTSRPLNKLGTITYLLTASQMNSFNNFIKNNYNSEKLNEALKSIITLYVIDASYVDLSQFEKYNKDPNYLTLSLWRCTGDGTNGEVRFTVGSDPYVLKSNSSNIRMAKQFSTNLSEPLPINEDTINGNIKYLIRTGASLDIPINGLDNSISSITSVGYRLYIDYRTGAYIVNPVVNNAFINEYSLNGYLLESFPFLYDEYIKSWREVGMNIFNQVLTTIFSSVVAGVIGGGVAGAAATAFGGVAGSLGTAFAQVKNSEAKGTSYKFDLGANVYRTAGIPSSVTISYTPTVNKQGYQDRFGKADMTSRNITQLTGPVQTINCVASMNNLNQSIIQSATMQCDNGIWIL